MFFIALIFLFHPWMGWIALFGALVLFGLAWLNEKLNRQQLENIQINSRRSSQFIDQGLRNADVVNGMGMLPGFVRHWRGLNQPVLEAMGSTGRRMGLVQSTSKFFRQIMQVAMMGTGAYLIIDQNLSPGIMIAATIIQGRAMALVEMLLGNWANLVQARSAFARMAPLLSASLEAAPPPGCRNPRAASAWNGWPWRARRRIDPSYATWPWNWRPANPWPWWAPAPRASPAWPSSSSAYGNPRRGPCAWTAPT